MSDDIWQPFYRVEEMQGDVLRKKEEILRAHGWQNTCYTPGSYWLWRRDFADLDQKRVSHWEARGQKGNKPEPYGVVTVPLDLAYTMTEAVLDTFGPADPDQEQAG